VLGIFIVAALITPTPDVFNQVLFAVPLGFLYLLSIGLAGIGERGRSHAGNDALGRLQTGG
jgi:sec-independent protein translocase protein TatC